MKPLASYAPGSVPRPITGRALARRLFWASAFLISYAEAYPFRLVIPPSIAGAWQTFISNYSLWTSGGDVVGNVILCVPLGVFGLAIPFGSRFRLVQLAAVFAVSVVFAFAMQAVQIFFPPREASLSDVVWNTVGIAVGMAIGAVLRRMGHQPGTRMPRDAWTPMVLLCAWLLTQLAPFIPSLDWQLIKDAIKPLVIDPRVDPVHLLYTAARVLAVGCLYAALRPRDHGSDAAVGFASLLIAVLSAKLIVVGQGLTPDNVLGFSVGYVAWASLRRQTIDREHLVALLALFIAYTADGLAPFHLRAVPARMHLLPFEALLQGAIEVNAWSLVEAVYVFGAMLWLVERIGGSVRGSAVALCLWVGLIEVMQMWLEGRTSDITMPMLVLTVGYILHSSSASRAGARRRSRLAPLSGTS